MLNIADERLEKEFKEFLALKLEKARKELAELESLVSGKNISISDTPDLKPSINDKIHNGYNNKWVWKKKIEYILTSKEGTTTEIVDTILSFEPNKYIRTKVVASVSAILSIEAGKSDGLVIKRLNDRDQNVYSLRNKVN